MSKPWHDELDALIKQHVMRSRKARKGKHRVVQEATVADREFRIRKITRDLDALNILPESVKYLKEKHVQSLVRSWESRNYAPSTLANNFSALRALIDWTGKRRDIRDPVFYLERPNMLRPRYQPPKTRCWSHLGVDPVQQIAAVTRLDPHVGMQLRAMHEFGLSRAEALRLKPWRADKGEFLSVTDGTRGRRSRVVGPLTDAQRHLVDELKAFVGPHPESSLSRPGQTLPVAIERFTYIMRKAGLTKKASGVTAYGLGRERELYEPRIADVA